MSTADANELYRRARKLHAARRLAEARDTYLEVLRLNPGHAGALHSLGNLDLRAGRLEDAERLIRNAIELAPHSPGFQNSLGNVLRARGDVDGAVAAYREELRLRPDFSVTHHQLALLALDTGALDQALARVQKAIFYAPRNPGAYNTMGRIYNNLGNLDAARQAFQRALVFDPASADAHFGLGHVKRRSGDLEAAVDDFRTAAAQDPTHLRARRELGITLLGLKRPLQAIDAFEDTLRLDPGDAAAHFGLGVIFQERGMIEAATEHFRQSVARDPRNPDAQCNLGAVLRSQGFFEAATTHFRRALELKPGHVPALSGLANIMEMRGDYADALELLEPQLGADAAAELVAVYATLMQRVGKGDEGIERIRQTLASGSMNDLDRMVLNFKLGSLLDKAGQYSQAWQAISTGNAMVEGDYDPARSAAAVDEQLKAWSADALAALPRSGNDSERPVFIVGMPRSGTSLVEQILASHPSVYGAGELNTIGLMALGLNARLGVEEPYPACIGRLDRDTLASLAGEYLGRIAALDTEAVRVTDKMWQNYEHLGLIEVLFPRARVVHCIRDPKDSLLSCYFQLFGIGGVPFSYSVENLLAAWEQYCRLMRHWRQVLGISMLEIRYESLVDDPEPTIRRLVDFVGLDFDPACLEFHRTRRAVTTASYNQVKQPMYRHSSGRFRNYEHVLDPRLLALEPLET